MEEHQLDSETPQKRPVFLTVIGILTFVNLGFSGLNALLGLMRGPASDEEIEEAMAMSMSSVNNLRAQGVTDFADTLERVVNMVKYANESFYLAMSLNLLIAVVGISAVIMMWKGMRQGFYLYVFSCLIAISSYFMYIPAGEVSMLMIGYLSFTTVLFSFLYWLNRKWMTR